MLCFGTRWDHSLTSCEPQRGHGPKPFPDATDGHHVQCIIHEVEQGMMSEGRHSLPICGHGTHALIKPTDCASSPTNDPLEYPRFRYRMLLSFRSPHSSASRAVLAVFWKWTATPPSVSVSGDCVSQEIRGFAVRNLPNNPNTGGYLRCFTGKKTKASSLGNATARGGACA